MGINAILKTQGINPDLIRKFDYLEDDSNLIIVTQIKGLNVGKKITEIELKIPRYKC